MLLLVWSGASIEHWQQKRPAENGTGLATQCLRTAPEDIMRIASPLQAYITVVPSGSYHRPKVDHIEPNPVGPRKLPLYTDKRTRHTRPCPHGKSTLSVLSSVLPHGQPRRLPQRLPNASSSPLIAVLTHSCRDAYNLHTVRLAIQYPARAKEHPLLSQRA